MDLLSLIPSVIGLISNQGAQKSANKAANRGKKLEDKQVQLFDTILQLVQQADQNGQFNPEQQIKQLEDDTAKYEQRDMGNLAGALRVAGYKPGDSEIGKRLDAVKTNYRTQLDSMRTNLRRGAFTDRLNAYQQVNPGMLNQGINNAYNSQLMALGQMQNPAGLFGAMMPFLQGKQSGQNLKQTPFAFLGNGAGKLF